MTTSFRLIRTVLLSMVLLVAALLAAPTGHAASAHKIDVSVDVALERFEEQVAGADAFLREARGVLVFPKVIKAGFMIGGEYGQGALRIDGKTVDYYSTAAASVGFQIGAQARTVVLIFMDDEALARFRHSKGWKVGVDGSVALINLGVGEAVDTRSLADPIVGFVFGNRGLMVNLTLEGAKFTKLTGKRTARWPGAVTAR